MLKSKFSKRELIYCGEFSQFSDSVARDPSWARVGIGRRVPRDPSGQSCHNQHQTYKNIQIVITDLWGLMLSKSNVAFSLT